PAAGEHLPQQQRCEQRTATDHEAFVGRADLGRTRTLVRRILVKIDGNGHEESGATRPLWPPLRPGRNVSGFLSGRQRLPLHLMKSSNSLLRSASEIGLARPGAIFRSTRNWLN